MELNEALDEAVRLFQEELGAGLTGVYAHGSVAMGCFNPKRSDIDLLIVVKEPLGQDTCRRLARRVLDYDDRLAIGRGVELSVVLEDALRDFRYKTPFEFHYSDFHRDRYRADEDYVCGGNGYADPDLAAHLTIAYHRGITLYGPQLHELCQPIDLSYYEASILADIENAVSDAESNPLYVTLNLCRVLHYWREGAISSKKEGGEWAISNLPKRYRGVVRYYVNEYTDNGHPDENQPCSEQLIDFAVYMRREIDLLAQVKNRPRDR
ncbi:aminoglycoside adenylyltransferase domain-containing protein [Paenibacillus methanolicus]|uniref:Spectinomycin 9-adenylyltransferase n=1 Tax=Paenibacillus methanolicus TaxID=582686 RepID=A0A5S5C1P6_9BACL|nr:aminoglycoside adenylyltransferase domain-containing protein [Paenibacillus methanolicus]TYP72356.1 streptomycin 3'-adenylyltransferase [Paenibacillus methanolicus]